MGGAHANCHGGRNSCWSWLTLSKPANVAVDAGDVADVIIVGAGLAGLACALRLKEQGVKSILLEAREFVGGRASRGGADFVHGEHVTTWKYLERFGLRTDGSLNGWHELRDGGPECWIYVDGKLRGPEQIHQEPNRIRFFAKMEELTQSWIEQGNPDVCMKELAKCAFDQPPTEDEVRLMDGMLAEWHAADLEDVGVYEDDLWSERIRALTRDRPSLLAEDGDEGHWRIIGGHQGLAEQMSKSLDMRLRTVVRRVQTVNKGDSVVVESSAGQFFKGQLCVVTVPLACIQDITFDPALPASKMRAVAGLGRGITTMVFLRFREQFWPKRMAFLFHSMSSQCFWPGRSNNVLTVYFGGATANKHLLALTDAAMVDEILRQLGVIFERPVESLQLLGSDVRRWDTDRFAKMSYSYCPVGCSSFRSDLGATCGNILWAGEATHPTKASYAHGALEEGERAADEAMGMLASRREGRS
eukprot:TRINITY_DN56144_c0_g1_i1.p1 TRINITY_DN56144_c0_g1~~TRINITY_DN56144_c0_g1_i1.p1  ORF type:complete len:473 (-),score=77.60 TRINITY_DN56144_c0_g1_i1:13-1431(-)